MYTKRAPAASTMKRGSTRRSHSTDSLTLSLNSPVQPLKSGAGFTPGISGQRSPGGKNEKRKPMPASTPIRLKGTASQFIFVLVEIVFGSNTNQISERGRERRMKIAHLSHFPTRASRIYVNELILLLRYPENYLRG
jgi:hypothetical protein